MMNLLPDLTIIIPNYNTKALLRQCLASIYRYTRDIQFEVICIDDGSSDGSPEMVEATFPKSSWCATKPLCSTPRTIILA